LSHDFSRNLDPSARPFKRLRSAVSIDDGCQKWSKRRQKTQKQSIYFDLVGFLNIINNHWKIPKPRNTQANGRDFTDEEWEV